MKRRVIGWAIVMRTRPLFLFQPIQRTPGNLAKRAKAPWLTVANITITYDDGKPKRGKRCSR